MKNFLSSQIPFMLALAMYWLYGLVNETYYVSMAFLFLACVVHYLNNKRIKLAHRYSQELALFSGCSEELKCPHIVAAALFRRGWLYRTDFGWVKEAPLGVAPTKEPDWSSAIGWRDVMDQEGLSEQWK